MTGGRPTGAAADSPDFAPVRGPGGTTRPAVVLVVEDDDSIADPLGDGLAYAGFQVRRVRTGREALTEPEADLVLLDLGLPDVDGGEVCRRLRSRSAAPIIVVTARGDEFDRVLLLEMGADDYVVKPFGFRELVARIRAVLRRSAPAGQPPTLTIGPLVIDPAARRVHLADRELDLTAKEFDLLAFLAGQPGTVRRREDIIAQVWDENWWGSTKTLDVHIAALRKKLGDARWITTLRGVGYRLNEPA
ncbi:response regulator transcription factor [Amycolatopsis sp. K13G38]|uniref:Response regulator transcription factor n=2 Tax=Amycolatopsis acididurans TaxID=2724524 RepID=A0ABX1IXX0_9PSEU|nr:response regulator transcription factor [Amycolatopsis acididurans]